MLTRQCAAHYSAWKKGIIHRDISAGNVLIKVTEYVKDGVLKKKRQGILCDWELSTTVSVTGATEDPRAIDRTVSATCEVIFERD